MQRSFGALIAPLALLVGCGPSEPFDYVQVSGKVTYEDGTLIEAAHIHITFLPQTPPIDRQIHPRAGIAEVNVADGTFATVTTHKYGDGLTPGEHIVTVQAFNEEMVATDAIPVRYTHADTTPLRMNSADSPFHIRIAR